MSRSTRNPRRSHRFDTADRLANLIIGACYGLGAFVLFPLFPLTTLLGIVAASVATCGILAYFFGDRFVNALGDAVDWDDISHDVPVDDLDVD